MVAVAVAVVISAAEWAGDTWAGWVVATSVAGGVVATSVAGWAHLGANAHLGGALGAGHIGGLGGRFGGHRFGGSGRRFAHHRGFQGFGFGDPLGYYDDYGYDQCWQIDRIRPSRLRYVC